LRTCLVLASFFYLCLPLRDALLENVPLYILHANIPQNLLTPVSFLP